MVGLMHATFGITRNRYYLSGGTSNLMARLRVLSSILVTFLSFAVFAMCIASYIIDDQHIFIPQTTFVLLNSLTSFVFGIWDKRIAKELALKTDDVYQSAVATDLI